MAASDHRFRPPADPVIELYMRGVDRTLLRRNLALTPEQRLLQLQELANRGNLMAMRKPIVSCSPDILGGTPVFAGTRVPIQTLIDYLEGGESIDEFLKGFPTVTREQVIAFLEEAKARVVESGA